MKKRRPPRKDQPADTRQRAPLKPESLPQTQYPPYFQADIQFPDNFYVLNNETYTDAVAWAEQVLYRERLPSTEFDEKFSSLLDLVEEKGFRKGKDLVWYAAAIRWYWTFIQSYYYAGQCFDSSTPHMSGRRSPFITIRGRLYDIKSLTAELDRLISKAQTFVDPISRSKRKGGEARGRQQIAAREEEWAKWREWANEFAKKYPRLKNNKKAIAEKIQGRIFRKENRHVGIRTITRQI
jgi:hypothetical protein